MRDLLPPLCALRSESGELPFGIFAMDGTGASGAGGSPEPEAPATPDAIDLSNPQIVAAINRARIEERQKAAADAEGLAKNKEEILKEKKKWSALGESPEAVQERLDRLEKLELEARGRKTGKDPEAFAEAVEAAAQEKHRQFERAQSAIREKQEGRVKELEDQVKELESRAHLSFVASEIYRASVPEDTRLFHEGARDHLIRTLAPYVEQHTLDGLPEPVGRLKVNGALVPGSAKDGYMDLRECLGLMRQPGGKSPLPVDLSYCFISRGVGSGTQTPRNGAPPGGANTNWYKMTEEQRTAYADKYGHRAAMELLTNSEPPTGGATSTPPG